MSEEQDITGRSVWSGTLSFGLVSTPIALFPAAREVKLSFNQLHDECKSRLKQQGMFCPKCNKPVAKPNIAKGYEVSRDAYVILAEAEIKSAAPVSSRKMEITTFVPETDVDAIYFASSFFVVVTDGGEKAYSLLREAMIFKGVVAIAKMFYSGKEHVAVVRPVPGGLMLHTLFWANEIRSPKFQRLPEVNDAELSIACQFVDHMAGKFDPSGFEDASRTALLEVIQRKQAGETINVESVPRKQPAAVDITAALLASIQAARKPAVAGGVQ